MALPITQLPKHDTKLPFSGETVKFRPFTVREEKILMMASTTKDPDEKLKASIQIIENCTFGKVDVAGLPYGDLQWLLTMIRSRSVGDTVIVSHTCDNDGCGKENQIEIDLTKMKLNGPLPNNKIMLTDTVGVVLKFPSISLIQGSKKDEDGELIDDNKKGDLLLDFMMGCIESIFDEDQVWETKDVPREELENFVLDLTNDQSMKIKDFFESIPRLEIVRKYKCKHCGKEHELKVDTFENFTS